MYLTSRNPTKMKRTNSLLLTFGTAMVLVCSVRADDKKMIDTRAETIAKGDVTAIMADYSAEPALHWIGGPLAGEYKGVDAIQGVWTKFTGMMAPLTVKTSGAHMMDSNTAMAEAAFTNKAGKTIMVELSEKAAGGKIKEETWKVNAPAAPAKAN